MTRLEVLIWIIACLFAHDLLRQFNQTSWTNDPAREWKKTNRANTEFLINPYGKMTWMGGDNRPREIGFRSDGIVVWRPDSDTQ